MTLMTLGLNSSKTNLCINRAAAVDNGANDSEINCLKNRQQIYRKEPM